LRFEQTEGGTEENREREKDLRERERERERNCRGGYMSGR